MATHWDASVKQENICVTEQAVCVEGSSRCAVSHSCVGSTVTANRQVLKVATRPIWVNKVPGKWAPGLHSSFRPLQTVFFDTNYEMLPGIYKLTIFCPCLGFRWNLMTFSQSEIKMSTTSALDWLFCILSANIFISSFSENWLLCKKRLYRLEMGSWLRSLIYNYA